MAKIFLTFADSRMHRSVERICKQAQSFQFYDRILHFNENDLAADFRETFKCQLVFGSRGYGYWCWKPQIILQVLKTMNDGDILQYTDAGCHLNKKGIKRLEEYFSLTADSEKGILVFQSKEPALPLEYDGRKLLHQPDYKWVKGDVLDYFNVRHNTEITHSETIGAGIIFIKKCSASMKIINAWHQAIEDNFSLINDELSKSENLEGFIEHRHDQAIFSIICKMENIKTISAYEYWYPSKYLMIPDWNHLKKFPIHAKRDKDLGSIENTINLSKRAYRKIIYLISRKDCN